MNTHRRGGAGLIKRVWSQVTTHFTLETVVFLGFSSGFSDIHDNITAGNGVSKTPLKLKTKSLELTRGFGLKSLSSDPLAVACVLVPPPRSLVRRLEPRTLHFRYYPSQRVLAIIRAAISPTN